MLPVVVFGLITMHAMPALGMSATGMSTTTNAANVAMPQPAADAMVVASAPRMIASQQHSGPSATGQAPSVMCSADHCTATLRSAVATPHPASNAVTAHEAPTFGSSLAGRNGALRAPPICLLSICVSRT